MSTMKLYIYTLILSALSTISIAQTVDCSRTATLHGSTAYDTEGTAYLERMLDGSVQLRLGADFKADSGPDVQVYLSNDSTSIAGGVMIVDLGSSDGIAHFSGEITFQLSDVDIDEYDYLVFRCIQFNAYWGGGTWSEGDCGGGIDVPIDTTGVDVAVCPPSLVATTDWASEVTVCPTDGIPDSVELRSSIEVDLGVDYSFLIVDGSGALTAVVETNYYDFEGSSLDTQYVYGVSYKGALDYSLGAVLDSVTADSCLELSSLTTFLTVIKEDCDSTVMVSCPESTTATTDWASEVTVCPTDGIPDSVELRSSIDVDLGVDYSFLIVDGNGALTAVVETNYYDFEGSGLDTQYVYGVSYKGALDYTLGAVLDSVTADSCLELSSLTTFLTVIKEDCDSTVMVSCPESTISSFGGVQEVTVCPNDGLPDSVALSTSIEVDLGVDYSYLIVNAEGNLTAVVEVDHYNFEGSSLETEYVYGVAHRGTLDYTLGTPIDSITADSCAQLSSLTSFLTINKTNCAPTHTCLETNVATTGWVSEVNICPSDSIADVILFINNQAIEAGDHYAYIITDTMRQVITVAQGASYDFEGSGDATMRVYGVSYAGSLDYSVGVSIDSITADSCYILSDSMLYLTVNKTNCDIPVDTTTFRSVSGRIVTASGEAIAGATVTASGTLSATTDAEGYYTLDSIATDVAVTIVATYDDLAANGMSSLDLILVTRHILDIEAFSDPVQLIAADVNGNGSVSSADLVVMQRVLLDLDSGFSGQPSWQLLDAGQELDLNILSSGVAQQITIEAGTTNVTEVDFVAIKTGDVNGSVSVE